MNKTIGALILLWLCGCSDSTPVEPPEAAWEGALDGALRAGSALPVGPTHAALEAALWRRVAAADSLLASAALQRLPEVWDGRLQEHEATLLAALRGSARIQTAAIRTAGAALASGEASPALREALLELARSHLATGARFLAQEELAGLPPQPDTSALLVAALGDSSRVLVGSALLRLSGRAHDLPGRDTVRAACAQLCTHPDPGVRGAALALRAQLVEGSEQKRALAEVLLGALRDAHPYVRSQAALALGRLRRKESLAALVERLDDQAPNAYVLAGFTLPDGSPGRLAFQGSTWGRVDDAVLEALQWLSMALPEPFDYGPIRPEHVATDLARQASLARMWYEDMTEP